jgi:hypothetical protein
MPIEAPLATPARSSTGEILKRTFQISVRNLTQPHPEELYITLTGTPAILPILDRLALFIQYHVRQKVRGHPFTDLGMKIFDGPTPDDEALLAAIDARKPIAKAKEEEDDEPADQPPPPPVAKVAQVAPARKVSPHQPAFKKRK